MIVLDTHTLLWWIDASAPLPVKATKIIKQAIQKKSLYISAMSFWEIAMLHKKGRLALSLEIHTWVEKVLLLPSLHIIDPTPSILINSLQLQGLSPDPADRIIVATALKLGFPLVTKDQAITSSGVVKTIWD
ncbi:MAG TPA: VapC toxin family PIN domain ribonuclease [Deltaproteobacteria bacterium]|nr:MAG: hypothetical protein A2048_05040 [Deltaproteobacteria bacterium GWA2_45_12]HBF12854.1 VapC toxin family PIN domain ribonuclease [Deltaproteobacteria bacterium]